MDERLAKLRAEERDAERERTGLAARKEALELGLNRKDGAGALLAASEQVNGLMGSVAALLSVRTGYETAIAAALGEAADAVAVTHTDAALQAVGHLKQHDLGRAGLLLGDAPADDYTLWPPLPYGASYAVDVVDCPDEPAAGAAAAAAQGRRGRRRTRGSIARTEPARRHLHHPRRRRTRGAFRVRRFGRGTQPDRGAVRGRRGGGEADRGDRAQRAAAVRAGRRWRTSGPGRRSPSRSRWPGCTSRTRRWRPWPSSWPTSGRWRRRPAARRSGWPRRSRRPRRSATGTCPAWPSSKSG